MHFEKFIIVSYSFHVFAIIYSHYRFNCCGALSCNAPFLLTSSCFLGDAKPLALTRWQIGMLRKLCDTLYICLAFIRFTSLSFLLESDRLLV